MLEPVADGAWRVDLGNVNAYLVDAEEGPVVIDAGMPGKHTALREAMEEAGLDPDALARVLVTHTDLDHVGGLKALVDGTEATIHLSQTAADLLTGGLQPPWLSTKGLFQRLTRPWLDPPSPERFRIAEEGDEIGRFAVIETPGHALGHLAFVDIDRKICFIGDLVRTEGRVQLPPRVINYDTDEALESIHHLLETAPGFEAICAGHGDPVLEEGYAELKALVTLA